MWQVLETKNAVKQLCKLPQRVKLIYRQLVDDFTREGAMPYGWDVSHLKGSNEFRVRLNREYRVVFQIMRPNIVVIKIAHRKEVYK